jgi:Na+-transporting methylmalonyl-CoA/oxaloacetate decarboxylase gamma subunit
MYPKFEEALLALVIGMGGVMAFLAVLTLVTAMITRVWKEPTPGTALPAGGIGAERSSAVASLHAAPAGPGTGARLEGGAVAAAVAVGLHLGRTGARSEGEAAAAIGAALALHRARSGVGIGASRGGQLSGGEPWKLAGNLEAMGGRSQRRARARSS